MSQQTRRKIAGDGLSAALDAVATLPGYVREIGRPVAISGLLVGWIAVWSLVARLNYLSGRLLGVVTTLGLLVLPASGILLWYTVSRVRSIDRVSFTADG